MEVTQHKSVQKQLIQFTLHSNTPMPTPSVTIIDPDTYDDLPQK